MWYLDQEKANIKKKIQEYKEINTTLSREEYMELDRLACLHEDLEMWFLKDHPNDPRITRVLRNIWFKQDISYEYLMASCRRRD